MSRSASRGLQVERRAQDARTDCVITHTVQRQTSHHTFLHSTTNWAVPTGRTRLCTSIRTARYKYRFKKKPPSKDVIVINITTAARLNPLFVAICPLVTVNMHSWSISKRTDTNDSEPSRLQRMRTTSYNTITSWNIRDRHFQN